MTDDDKKDILKAIVVSEERIRSDIAGKRQHEVVNIDAMVADVKATRRMVEWLKLQWEKFSRPTNGG